MQFKKYSELNVIQQKKVIEDLQKKVLERKTTFYDLFERQKEIEPIKTTIENWLNLTLQKAEWAIFDEKLNIFIFETSCM
jgi:hypothetical protein